MNFIFLHREVFFADIVVVVFLVVIAAASAAAADNDDDDDDADVSVIKSFAFVQRPTLNGA